MDYRIQVRSWSGTPDPVPSHATLPLCVGYEDDGPPNSVPSRPSNSGPCRSWSDSPIPVRRPVPHLCVGYGDNVPPLLGSSRSYTGYDLYFRAPTSISTFVVAVCDNDDFHV